MDDKSRRETRKNEKIKKLKIQQEIYKFTQKNRKKKK